VSNIFIRVVQRLSRDYKWSFLTKSNYAPNSEYFARVYERKLFGKSESVSGPGSDLSATEIIRIEIPKLLSSLGIKSVSDVPCGDLFWFSNLNLKNTEYLGFDIVPKLIFNLKTRYPEHKFQVFDATVSILPRTDLIICRDLLVHLTTEQALRVIKNFTKSGSKFLLTTTFPETGMNQELVVPKVGVGWRPLNLAIAPFNLGTPKTIINEGSLEGRGKYKDKSLALWQIN
jgi:hypothetical protein